MAKKSKLSKKLPSHSHPIEAAPMADMDFRARSDCHTLREAEEIRNDKKRHGAAKGHAKKEMAALKRVAT